MANLVDLNTLTHHKNMPKPCAVSWVGVLWHGILFPSQPLPKQPTKYPQLAKAPQRTRTRKQHIYYIQTVTQYWYHAILFCLAAERVFLTQTQPRLEPTRSFKQVTKAGWAWSKPDDPGTNPNHKIDHSHSYVHSNCGDWSICHKKQPLQPTGPNTVRTLVGTPSNTFAMQSTRPNMPADKIDLWIILGNNNISWESITWLETHSTHTF